MRKNQKKRKSLSTVVFYSLIVIVMLCAVSTYFASGLVARYTTSGEATDSARVAKWDINFSAGSELHSVVQSTHLEAGSKGEWGLDIVNNSEVAARLADSSSVKLRLYSPNFDVNHYHNAWDFLHDNSGNIIDNPINFKICLYNCSLEALEEDLKDDNLDNAEEVTILDTNQNLTFQLIIEDGVLYYETIVDFESLNLGSDFDLAVQTGNACLRVLWNVDGASNQATTKEIFTSYHLIKTSEFDTLKYLGIIDKSTKTKINIKDSSMTDDEITSAINANVLHVDTDDYVIAYKEYDYFGYYIYTATFDGDLKVTIDGNPKAYSKLTTDEISAINNRTIASDGSKLYVEALQFAEYDSFMIIKNAYDNATGYLNLGLECRIMLNLKVEQID